MPGSTQSSSNEACADRSFVRGLGLFDSVMVVIGVMIGSGIFIVSAEMARDIGSPGGLLTAWLVTGILTIGAALSYGELASMMPHAGGMYLYLREAFSPLWGFLYGWTLFVVIQTGTIAAVAVAFARFCGVLWPVIAENHYLIAPIHISSGYALSFSTAQVVAILVIVALSLANVCGLQYGKWVQNIFTAVKTGALAALILVGLSLGWSYKAVTANFHNFWTPHGFHPLASGLNATSAFGFAVAICIAQSGSLFAADSWHDITFAAPEVKNPRRTLPLAMAIGTVVVIILYMLANLAYLVSLPLASIQNAPYDRVATAMFQAIFPRLGPDVMAIAIMISTFGCINSLVLAGPRVYYAMARQHLFFARAGRLNRARVPGWSIVAQCVWSIVLLLPRTYNPETKAYGNLYSNLLDYIISAALVFYIMTIAGLFRLRSLRPGAERPYRAIGYPIVPALYSLGAAAILASLFAYRSSTTWPGLVILSSGVPIYWLFATLGVKSRLTSE